MYAVSLTALRLSARNLKISKSRVSFIQSKNRITHSKDSLEFHLMFGLPLLVAFMGAALQIDKSWKKVILLTCWNRVILLWLTVDLTYKT